MTRRAPACGRRLREHRVRPRGAGRFVGCERLRVLARVDAAGQRGQLVDRRPRAARRRRPRAAPARRARRRSRPATPRSRSAAALLLGAGERRDLVAGGEQPLDQRPADGAGGAGDEDPHRRAPPGACAPTAASQVTPSSAASEIASNAPTQPGSVSPTSTTWLTTCSAPCTTPSASDRHAPRRRCRRRPRARRRRRASRSRRRGRSGRCRRRTGRARRGTRTGRATMPEAGDEGDRGEHADPQPDRALAGVGAVPAEAGSVVVGHGRNGTLPIGSAYRTNSSDVERVPLPLPSS